MTEEPKPSVSSKLVGNDDTNATESLRIEAEMKDDKTDKQADTSSNHTYYLRYVSLIVLVIQNASQVLLMRYATRREQPQFVKTVAVFWNEIIKLVAALTLFIITTGSMRKTLRLLRHHFITDFFDTLKVGVPAFIYTIQNFLLYVALEHLDAGTFMVTYQLKILTTAVFTVFMLHRRLSWVQWLSLLVLTGGVALVQISAEEGSKKAVNALNSTLTDATELSSTLAPSLATTPASSHAPAQQQPLIGLAAVLTACVMSGFAGIYFEKILKGSKVSLWLRNVQLAILAIPISLAVIVINDRDRVMKGGFMQGFDLIVWCVVLLQALGGLVVAVVVKYADNILKAFATSIAIVVAAVTSAVLFSVFPKPLFLAGALLVMIAVVLYSVYPYRTPTSSVLDAHAAAAPLIPLTAPATTTMTAGTAGR